MTVVTEKASKAPANDMWVRLVSSVVLAVPVLVATYFGPPVFTIMIIIIAIIMGREWSRMCKRQPGWMLLGALYIALPCGAMIWLRGNDSAGLTTLLWLFFVVWASDIGAYLVGRTLGGPKLAPRVSPKKTWSGFIGGILLAGVVSGIFASRWDGDPIILGLWGVLVGIAAQGGDLIESAAKRHFGVKDTSSLIPGHGGVLDRVDGLIAGALGLAILKFTLGKAAIPWL